MLQSYKIRRIVYENIKVVLPKVVTIELDLDDETQYLHAIKELLINYKFYKNVDKMLTIIELKENT